MVKEKTIEETYQKLSQREHVLRRSGVYIGDIKKNTEELWVLNENNKMGKKFVEYSPAFMKIFDEILSNATDHAIRDSTVNKIEVNYSKETGEISVYNNGSGVPVVLHKEQNIYVPELIFGHLLSGSSYNDSDTRTTVGTNGLGAKCHSHDTKIPLFNGEIKLAKDININDILIGDDGNQRKVLSKIFGKGKMYEISQNRGENYKVNDEHILTLHMPDHKVIFWNTNGWSILWWDNINNKINTKFIKAINKDIKCEECNIELSGNLKRHYKRMHKNKEIPIKSRKLPNNKPDINNEKILRAYNEIVEFSQEIDDNNVFDISIKDYINLSKTTQSRLAGVRGNCVNWEYQHIELDPYVLGLWLGDGMKSGYSYACDGKNDYQLIDYLKEWGLKNDDNIKQTTGKYTCYISSINNFNKWGSSPLRNLLKKYDLINNKHIPKEYLINSREVRLTVLAGFIDTDGTLSRDGTRIGISQSWKHEKLIFELLYLARSLGFCCSIRSFMAKYKLMNGEEKESKAYMLNISGNIQDIPTLLFRKKCNNTKKQNTDKSTGQIKIKEIDDTDYVGIHIDGNERFLINDFTVTHNCTNIFSKKFIIETVDNENKKKFIQEFSNNMSDKTKPKISSAANTKSYTKITFIPDYQRFSMENLEDDTILLIKKRVYDCIANTKAHVNLYLNGEKIKGKSFTDYIKYYFDDSKIISEQNIQTIKGTEFIWEYAIVPSDHYEQISFVNGNCTYLGGKHVDYILYQIINKIKELLETKKKLKDVKPNFIKDKFCLFLKATVINPSFNSQTKETLTTQVKDFGCKIEVTESFINKIYKSSIIDEIVAFCKLKESSNLSKVSDGKKVNKVYLPKLEDAIYAGTTKSDQCTLILTEGDSAKTFAMWGRAIIGPEKYGVFPLKGKLLNVRDATISQLINNEEINNIKQILGLKEKKVYTDTKELRYGRIMLLTDADYDGSHIKSLVANFIHNGWPSLLKIKSNFIQTFKTPIVKAIKGKDTKEFFTEQDYHLWLNSSNTKGYEINYYKGLGTTPKDDAKKLFKRFDDLIVNYYHKDNKCDESILLAFDKDKNQNNKVKIKDTDTDVSDVIQVNCTDKRKAWLANYNKDIYIDIKENVVSYQDLINKELIHFSIYDNTRSIPSICDGLKPSQRKILYYMLNKNVNVSMKVAQLSGKISSETSYHHGEASLEGAIVGLAQDFVGTNNINLLYPDGNMGSRLLGGKDAASARYIKTRLSDITPLIFNKLDFGLLNLLKDDGIQIEPEWYLPIIPIILINGCDGIGTGYSTSIPPYNPKDLINNILRVMDDKDPLPLIPFYKNFNGELIKDQTKENTFITKGKWEKLSDTQIKVTELPVGCWVTIYKEFLESLIETNKKETKNKKKFVLKSIENRTTDEEDDIDFLIEFKNSQDLDLLIKSNTLEKELKLTKSINTNNMHVFSESLILTKYTNPNDILLDWYDQRLEYYQKRKDFLVKKFTDELIILKSKIRFITEYIDKIIDINKKSKEYITNLLKQCKYPDQEGNYDYLLNLPVYAFTEERIEALNKQVQNKQAELDYITSKTDKGLWKIDLLELNKYL